MSEAVAQPAPPRYVPARAWHILPETTSDESGYFSLSEGLDGTVYVGTAKYNQDAFLVAFDPRKGTQRIAVDVNQVCGLTASGYAAQAKIHTRNWVGASGTIYCGSKQGYRSRRSSSDGAAAWCTWGSSGPSAPSAPKRRRRATSRSCPGTASRPARSCLQTSPRRHRGSTRKSTGA